MRGGVESVRWIGVEDGDYKRERGYSQCGGSRKERKGEELTVSCHDSLQDGYKSL